MKVRIVLLASILAAALVATPPAAAQTVRGSIGGVVKDPSGAVISGAKVDLLDSATNQRRSATSDSQGVFSFAALAAGTYTLDVEHTGFSKSSRSITLQVNQDYRHDVPLAVGRAATDTTIVAATPEVVRTTNPSIGTVIDNRQITGLPLDGRNWTELGLLVTGVAPAAQGSAGSVRGDIALNVNGGREDANFFSLDGAYNGDPKLNGIGVVPPVDAIREFEVLTNSYDATFGRNSAGQINVVTKTGTNQWHGAAYWFFRNAALDGRNHFAPTGQPDPKFQRNQFGASLGGPIVRDRTFFFGDYERRLGREGITRIANVPTLAERSGDFSASCLPAPGPGCPFVAAFGGFLPFIPPAFQHPVGAAIGALYPAPNRTVPGANFVSSPVERDDEHQFDVRLDHRFSDRSELTARYSFSDRDFFEPFPGSSGNALVPGYGNSVPRRAQNLLIGETHTFTPSLLNEFRFAFSRTANRVNQEGQGTSTNAAVGLPNISTNPRDWGLSLISLVGFSTIGNERVNPQRGINDTFQFLDQATWVRGRHTVKFGMDFRYMQQNAFRDVEARGFLSFFGVVTGNPVADLLLGIPTVTGAARSDNPQTLRAESYSFFLNDTWQVRPTVALTFGLRYELLSPPVDPADRANIFNSATGGLSQVGTSGVPRAGYATDKNNWGPRIGIAWNAARNTVLRAGYGVYFDQSPLAPGEGLYFSQPYFDFRLFFLFTGLPPLSLTDPWPFATFPVPTAPSATTFQRDLRAPYVQHWSLSWQQKLGATRVLEFAYAASKGTRLLNGRDINQSAPSVVVPNLRPNPLFDDVKILESRGNSTYNSLQIRFQQNLDFGLTVLSSYSWSKSIDDASGVFSTTGDPNFPQDSNNAAAERGLSNFDLRHRYSLAFSYDIPGPRENAWARRVFGGWQSNGILALQSGRPFTVALNSNLDQSNTGRTALGFGANDRPNVTGNPESANPTESAWFNTAAFSLQSFGSFGNAGRNILAGPGLATFNFSLLKNMQATEQLNVQFRTEFFNLFDRVNYDLPDNFFRSPTFGRILSASQPRRIQFGLKLLW